MSRSCATSRSDAPIRRIHVSVLSLCRAAMSVMAPQDRCVRQRIETIRSLYQIKRCHCRALQHASIVQLLCYELVRSWSSVRRVGSVELPMPMRKKIVGAGICRVFKTVIVAALWVPPEALCLPTRALRCSPERHASMCSYDPAGELHWRLAPARSLLATTSGAVRWRGQEKDHHVGGRSARSPIRIGARDAKRFSNGVRHLVWT